MSDNASSVNTKKNSDPWVWLLVSLLTIGGIYGNYYFSAQSILLRVVGLLLLAGLVVFLSVKTKKGVAIQELLIGAKNEIRKVVWPTRQEVLQTTIVVLAVVILVGLILWGEDSLLSWVVKKLIG